LIAAGRTSWDAGVVLTLASGHSDSAGSDQQFAAGAGDAGFISQVLDMPFGVTEHQAGLQAMGECWNRLPELLTT
jgi:hypothetical protein